MFVSSYSTYINTSTSDKTNKLKIDTQKDELKPFSSELSKSTSVETYSVKKLPIDYVSNYKTFNNQQKMQDQTIIQEEQKLKKISTLNSAKTAYEDNSKIFSPFKKPTVTLSQTSQSDRRQPKNIQDIQISNLKNTMLNTYIENDSYYKITAS